jgi:hypothetical protein
VALGVRTSEAAAAGFVELGLRTSEAAALLPREQRRPPDCGLGTDCTTEGVGATGCGAVLAVIRSLIEGGPFQHSLRDAETVPRQLPSRLAALQPGSPSPRVGLPFAPRVHRINPFRLFWVALGPIFEDHHG